MATNRPTPNAGAGIIKRCLSQSGPLFGRGHGQPWRGLVEETPALWISWVKMLCESAGVELETFRLVLGGEAVAVEHVAVGFGRRPYFLCPACGHRCEALFLVTVERKRKGRCRTCARLGYLSQSRRPSSLMREVLPAKRRKRPGRHGSSTMTKRERALLDKLWRDLTALRGGGF